MIDYNDYLEYLKHIDDVTEQEIAEKEKALNNEIDRLKGSLSKTNKVKDELTTSLNIVKRELGEKKDVIIQHEVALKKERALVETTQNLLEETRIRLAKAETSLSDEIRKNNELTERNKDIADELQHKDTSNKRLLDELNENIKIIAQHKATIKQNADDLETIEIKRKTDLHNLNQIESDFSIEKEKNKKLNETIESLSLQVTNLKSDKNKIEDNLSKAEKQINQKLKDWNQLTSDYSIEQEKNKKLNETIESLSFQVTQLKSENHKIENKSSQIKARIEQMQNEQNKLEKEINIQKEKVGALTQLNDTLVLEKTNTEQMLANCKKEIEELRNQNTDVITLEQKYNKQLEQLKSVCNKEKTTLEGELESLIQQVGKYDDDIKKLNSQLTGKEHIIAQLKTELENITHSSPKKKRSFLSGLFIGGILILIIGFLIWPKEHVSTKEDYVTQYTYNNGDSSYVYTGQIMKNLPHGIGKAVYADGDFEGVFKEGKRLFGRRFFNNATIYIGSYKNEKANGYGTFQYADGSKYTGEFVDDKLEGLGTFFDKDGNILAKGTFKNNKFIK